MRRLTPLGWGMVLASLFGWSVGIALGWVELIGMGIFTIVLVAFGGIASFGKNTLDARLVLTTTRVIVGKSGVGVVKVRNMSSRTSRATWLELPVGKNVIICAVPRLDPGAEHEQIFTIPTKRRGMVTIGPVSSVRSDPLGLVHACELLSDKETFFVHPLRVPLNVHALGFLHDVEGRSSGEMTSSDVSFRALRPYVRGDAQRAIHWKTSAHIGQLMVRQFDDTRRSHMLIVLDSDLRHWTDADEFELGVSLAASIAAAELSESRLVKIVWAGQILADSTPVDLMDSLAVIQPRLESSLEDDVATAVSCLPSVSICMLVTSTEVSREELRRTLSVLPHSVRSIVVRAGKETALSQLDRMCVLTIAQLADAPLAFAKAVK
ncbi:DUF58 domain-containing protein [Arcanobacterium canis]